MIDIEEKICFKCEYYKLVKTPYQSYWWCRRQKLQVIDNKCDYYSPKKKIKGGKNERNKI